jgi:hypothetical protein
MTTVNDNSAVLNVRIRPHTRSQVDVVLMWISNWFPFHIADFCRMAGELPFAASAWALG